MARYFFRHECACQELSRRAWDDRSTDNADGTPRRVRRVAARHGRNAFWFRGKGARWCTFDRGIRHTEGKFLADVKQRVLLPVRIVNAHYQLAGSLISHHGMSRQVRTLDAIHLAVALRLHRAAPVDRFVCADQRLCEIAALEGLTIFNPERP